MAEAKAAADIKPNQVLVLIFYFFVLNARMPQAIAALKQMMTPITILE